MQLERVGYELLGLKALFRRFWPDLPRCIATANQARVNTVSGAVRMSASPTQGRYILFSDFSSRVVVRAPLLLSYAAKNVVRALLCLFQLMHSAVLLPFITGFLRKTVHQRSQHPEGDLPAQVD